MTTENSRADALTETKLPDGSGFAVASLPLPKDHWLYADRTYSKPDQIEPDELPMPILTHRHRDAVVAAVRYAVRGATMCGKEADFDPDALVLNAVYALCGPHGQIIEEVPTWKRDIQKVIDSLDPEDWCGDESMISALERAILAASSASQPAAAPIDVLHTLRAAKQFIANGIELGFIRMPDSDCPDPAHEVPKLIDAAIASFDNSMIPRPDLECAHDYVRSDGVCTECGSLPAPSPADERAVHALDCQYILDDNPWAICTCGKGSPNNPRDASANETVAEGATWYDRWQAECTRDHGEYDENAPISDRLRWWVPKSARHGTILLEDDLREAADDLSRSPAQADARVGLTEALADCLKIIDENRKRIGYEPGSPNDKTVRAARALLQGTNHAE